MCPRCSSRMRICTLVGPHGVLRVDWCGPCGLAMTSPRSLIHFVMLHAIDRSGTGFDVRDYRPESSEYGEVDERDRAFAFVFQLPIELSRNVRVTPPLTIALIAACILIFAVELVAGADFIETFSLQTHEFAWSTLFTMFTSCFLHADLFHLGGNLYFLYAFGRLLEDRLGEVGLLLLFAISGYLSSLGFFLAHWGEETASIGASGAIAGILGAYFSVYPLRLIGYSIYFTVIRIPAVLYLGLWFLMQFLMIDDVDGIAYSAHVWGFLVGMSFGLLIRTNSFGLNGLLIKLPDLSDVWLKSK